MSEKFNESFLKNINYKKINNYINKNIIIERKNKFIEKLNCKIINIKDNYIHVRYYDNNKINMLTNNTNEEYGLDSKKYNPINYPWLDKFCFVEDGLDDIIKYDESNNLFYYPYLKYPFFNAKYGNIFTKEYYYTRYKIEKIKLEYINTMESDKYTELPSIINKELNINNPVRIKNKKKNIIGCIIQALPIYILNKIIITSDNKEECIKKYILMHLNISFIKKLSRKYSISIKELYILKDNLKKNIIKNNYLIGILCTELLPINIKIFKYIDNDNIEVVYIMNDNIIDINIYNIGDIYELIIMKNLYEKKQRIKY